MKRYTLRLAYNGKNYFGWQRQPREISVQEVIEDTLTKLNHNHKVAVLGCGRTDTGVHAADYILHFDFDEIHDLAQFIFRLNRMLPRDIVIFEVNEVAPDFHARFDAKSRTYRYFVQTQKNCFNYGQRHYVHLPLDIDKMNAGAKLFLGKQDFTSFSKLHTDVKTNICDVTVARWVQTSDDELFFEITSDRFLRNMVRAIVGTLLEVGLGKIPVAEITTILAEKDRGKASSSAPGNALFLWEVKY